MPKLTKAKGALQRVRKIGNAHIFGPLICRESAQHRLVGWLSLDDIQEAGRTVRRLAKQ